MMRLGAPGFSAMIVAAAIAGCGSLTDPETDDPGSGGGGALVAFRNNDGSQREMWSALAPSGGAYLDPEMTIRQYDRFGYEDALDSLIE